jgi:ribosomal protein S18 acetylase RimI-like enzyme
MAGHFEIHEARERDIASCRELFVEYQQGLGVSLCFQGFDQELAGLPGDYAPPRGAMWLATVNDHAAGCVALRALDAHDAEMKRLYVRAAHRGLGLGHALAQLAIVRARELGYRRLRLDTLPAMADAQALYARLGFVDTAPYNDNPVPGVRFMALDLG